VRPLASLALSLAICTGPAIAHAADDGVINKPSKYSVKETVTRFETSSEKYSWMNRICSIASGSLSANARTLDVFQVL
jgi:hypothetical protein